MTVANKPGHRGEHEATVKTIARGMPGDPGVTVVTNARVYYTTRAAAGASGARHSLRPLIFRGRESKQNSGAMRGEIAKLRLESEPRHCEERRDEAIQSHYAALWIASLALAMTKTDVAV